MRTGVSGINLHIIGLTYRAITWGCIILLLVRWVKYANDGLVGRKYFLIQICILLIAFYSYYNSGRDELLLCIIFIIGAVNTSRDDAFRTAFRANTIGMLIVIICALTGIISNSMTVSLRNGANVSRYSMGFSHPNAFAALVLQLTALYIYFNFKTIKVRHLLLLEVANYFIFRVTYSRTSFVLATLLLMVIFIYKKASRIGLNRLSEWVINNTSKVVLLLGAAGSIYVALNYRKNLQIFSFLTNGDTLQTRIRLLGQALEIYPITLFGQVINTVRSSEYNFTLGNGVVLDNAYIFLLLAYGIVLTIVLVVFYLKTLKCEYLNSNVLFVICAILFIILGFSEKYFVSPMYNFTLLGLADVFYQGTPKIHNNR